MKVIVTGAGAVGRHLANDLADRGHEVTLIDQDAAVIDKVKDWAPGVKVMLGDGSPAVGKPLYELRLPTDSAIVALLREGHVVIPQPETVFATGDEVVALSATEAESALRKAIVGDSHSDEMVGDSIDGAGSL